jgi:hypothetical protein
MRDDRSVRTTLDIDDDVLQAAKEIAASRRTTTGEVLSELARKGLEPKRKYTIRNGVPVLPRVPGRILTVEAVEQALDEE